MTPPLYLDVNALTLEERSRLAFYAADKYQGERLLLGELTRLAQQQHSPAAPVAKTVRHEACGNFSIHQEQFDAIPPLAPGLTVERLAELLLECPEMARITSIGAERMAAWLLPHLQGGTE